MGIHGIAAGSLSDDDEGDTSMTSEVVVGAPSATSYGDGTTVGQLGGKQGEAIVSGLHGKYYTQTSRGNVYYGSTAAAGLVFTIFSNASFIGLMVWNQSASKNLSMIRATVGPSANAATAAAGWGYCWLNAGYVIGTPVSAFTAITATRGSCLLGATGQGSSGALVGGGATLGTAFTWGRAATFGTSTGAVTTQLSVSLVEDFDGMMIVPPGYIFALTSTILTGITAAASLVWEECPL